MTTTTYTNTSTTQNTVSPNVQIHPWAATRVPDQSGKTILITGANSGIGYETARILAAKGALVIMACRSAQKAEQARDRILADFPQAKLDLINLDLGDLSSVARCAEEVLDRYTQLDVLINNAGIAWVEKGETRDGFESHFGTNHLGHFALTARLLPLLASAGNARVVSIASLAHRIGRIHFDDLNLNKGYGRARGYAQSKLANLMFGLELQRWLTAQGSSIQSLIVHPGMSATNLVNTTLNSEKHTLLGRWAERLTPWVAQDPATGSLPTLWAATSDQVKGGEYFGPRYALEIFGPPKAASMTRYAADPAPAKRLWDVSESLTGIQFEAALLKAGDVAK